MGGDYSSNGFKNFTQQEGIQIQYTVPYSPEQNGVAERLNRTLFKILRCFFSDLPYLVKELWAELVRIASYIKNRLPFSSNSSFLSLFEILYHRKPSIDHLRISESKCFYHLYQSLWLVCADTSFETGQLDILRNRN